MKVFSSRKCDAWLPRGRYELCYAAIPLLYFPAFYFLRVSRRAHDLDFGAYYAWAYGIRQGINPYIAERIRPVADRLNFPPMQANYPPIFILAYTPLTHLSVEHAFVLWSSINIALLIAAVCLLLAIVKPLPHPMLFGVAALMYGPVTDALFWGQAEVVVFFLLVVALWAMQNKKDGLCGVTVGIAVLCKIYPVLLLGCFWMCGRRVVVASACVAIAAGVVLSLTAFGLPIYLAFLRQIAAAGRESLWAYKLDFPLGATISRSLWLVAGKPLTPSMDRVRSVALFLAIPLVFLTTVYGTVIAKRQRRERLAFGLWVSAIVLVNPIVWFHHLILLLIPFALIIGEPLINDAALELSAGSYCFAALALTLFWIGWILWPSYQNLIQIAFACSATAALLLAFAGAAYACCQTGQGRMTA